MLTERLQQKTASYRLVNSVMAINTHIITNQNKKFESQRCNFRTLNYIDADQDQASLHFDNYQMSFLEHRRQTTNSISLQSVSSAQTCTFYGNSNIIDQETIEEEIEMNSEIIEINEFLEKSKQNIYKNILKSFKRHLKTCKDEKLQKEYESQLDNAWSFSYIKKRILQRVKRDNRISLQMKNIAGNEKFQKIFSHYLINSDQLWLQNSKIQNKEDYRKYISIILKANQKNIFAPNIVYYKKKTTSSE